MGCPGADVFHQLVEGTLARDDRAVVADHAGSCDECRALLGALLEVDAEPAQIDRYTIVKRIGAGAMGTVYEAHDPELDRKVAIKVLRGAGSAERLRREAQMLAKLHHPNVVAVYDAGEHEGRTFVAMALVAGVNLRAWLATERSAEAIVRVIRDAGRGLAAAHAAGVIHRDLKPDNIFIADDGSVLVGDFGLAFVDGERGEAAGGDGPVDLTQTGMVLGTPAYMAPEHAAGVPTAASDQFSLCVTGWEALHGARPFAGATFGEVQQAIERGELVAGKRPIPARVRTALERGLRAKPDERWASLAELDAALAPPRRRWPYIVATGWVLVAAAGMLALASSRRGPSCEFSLAELHLGSAAASYEHDWIALRSEVCRTPRPNDARLRCLDRAHDALKELGGSIPTADADLVHRAVDALPHLAACRDALDGDVAPETRMQGEALLARIDAAGVRVELSGGAKIDELLRLDPEAARLDYEPATVMLAIAEGSALSRAGRAEDASQILRAGLARAEAAHDDHGVANVVAELAPASTRLHKLDEAATLLELGDAAAVRAGHDDSTELALARAHADLAAAAGDHDKAIALARDLLAKVKARPGDTTIEQYEVMSLLVEQLTFAGRMKEAVDASHEAERLEVLFAKSSAMDFVTIERRFDDAYMTGQVERAIELAKQTVTLTQSMPDPSLRIESAIILSRAYEFARDDRNAIVAHQRVLELYGETCTPDQRSEAYEGIGNAYVDLGEWDKAIEPARKAFEIAAAGGKALDDVRWRAATLLARAQLGSGHAHEARLAIEPILHEVLTDPSAIENRRGGAELTLAQALWEDGGAPERARATALAADAQKDYEAGLVRLKGYPPALLMGLRKHLADAIEWRKHH